MRVTGRQGSTVAVVASGALVAGMGGLPAAQAVPAAPAAAADLQPVLPVKTELPDPWAAKAGNGVAFAGKARSRVEDEGDRMKIVLYGVDQGVRTRPNGASSGLLRKSLGGAWRGLDGNAMKGVVSGRTTGGATVSVPVQFSKRISVGKRTVVVYAFPTGGPLNEHVEDAFPALGAVKERAVGAKFRYLSVFATDADSRAWRFTSAGTSGRVTQDGAGVSVTVTKPGARGVGVQMNDGAATLPWDHIAKHWDKIAGRGVAPTVVVSGIGRKDRVRTITVRPESLSSGKSLVIKGEALAGYKDKVKRDLRTMRGVNVTLVASNAGHDTRYVVITGDSISSGESGRYIADYEAFNWWSGMGALNVDRFCKYADLACTDSSFKVFPKPSLLYAGPATVKASYDQNPSQVYEKGTQKAGECHRSYSAPGTWLARYYKVEQGDDVESINIACSGATTEAMTESFNKQRPQAEELDEIANLLHVPYVTNTMGANDIGFSSVALSCYMSVAQAFLNTDDSGEGDLLEQLTAQLPTLLDAKWNPWFGRKKDRDTGKFEKYDPYCHSDPSVGEAAERKIGTLPGKYKDALKTLLRSAPQAKVVAQNYPNLIPHNSQSSFPRVQYFGKSPRVSDYADLIDALSSPDAGLFPYWEFWSGDAGATAPKNPNFETMSQSELERNRKEWANYFKVVVLESEVIFGNAMSYPILTTMNLLYAKDMNWAAWKMIPDLNDAVYGTADQMGNRVIPVDQRQVLNGREYNTTYKGADYSQANGPVFDNGDFILGPPGNSLSDLNHMSYRIDEGAPFKGSLAQPDQLRATFVTAPLAGLPMNVPVLCPGSDEYEFTLDGKVNNGRCPGDMNEPLHPNWRGQAAQGQCLVAVVTGMLGDGNACVRSIGASAGSEPFSGPVWGFLKTIAQPDRLCVDAKPRDDYDWKEATPAKPYSDCDSTLSADPTWDTKRWDLVEEYGNWK